jgi:hypothetical protein
MLNGCQAGRKAERTNFHMFDQLRCAATHEAGHAVAALHFWMPLLEVSIEPNGVGATRYARRLGFGEIDRWVCVSYAGPAAELAVYGDADEAGDLRVIKQMLKALDLHWGADQLAEYRQRAQRLVEAERAAIGAVASELLRHRRLTADAIAAMLPVPVPEGALWAA